MRKAYLEVVCIRGVQRDLVVNRIWLYMYWLKLYKYKNWVKVKKRRGKTEKKTEKTLGIGGVSDWILLCWNAVLVLVLALALRVFLPGRVDL